ncbi:adenosine deaminase [Microbulbifer sp.]|uniref:adenosine deaminase n=1 Tax=Microbulbifer sp. TaxID=1908541 RepID=UPI003F2A9FBA
MNEQINFEDWLKAAPKAELHLHLDGTLEASRLLSLAEKKRIPLSFQTLEEVETAYKFENLQSFLDLYYLGASVLHDEEDFYHLMMDYLQRCRENNIVHTEIMIEPQTYLTNGIEFPVFMAGFKRAIADARSQWGQSALLILSFLRHMPEGDSLHVLELADAYRDDFVAIGLASGERGNPPQKFTELYRRARERGYHLTAHAGEEGPPAYIRAALDDLHVERIDHGVRCVEDESLVEQLCERQIPLTVCPLSNVRLRVFPDMKHHNILQLLQRGLKVTVNSDDPAYFGGYLNDNFIALYRELNLNRKQALQLLQNGFEASFLPAEAERSYLEQLRNFAEAR